MALGIAYIKWCEEEGRNIFVDFTLFVLLFNTKFTKKIKFDVFKLKTKITISNHLKVLNLKFTELFYILIFVKTSFLTNLMRILLESMQHRVITFRGSRPIRLFLVQNILLW